MPLFSKKKLYYYYLFLFFSFPSSKGDTTPFKPIYKCRWQQWSHHHIFPYYHNFIIHHYMTFKFEILIFGQKMRMDIKKLI